VKDIVAEPKLSVAELRREAERRGFDDYAGDTLDWFLDNAEDLLLWEEYQNEPGEWGDGREGLPAVVVGGPFHDIDEDQAFILPLWGYGEQSKPVKEKFDKWRTGQERLDFLARKAEREAKQPEQAPPQPQPSPEKHARCSGRWSSQTVTRRVGFLCRRVRRGRS
jgi:hypothetical protein